MNYDDDDDYINDDCDDDEVEVCPICGAFLSDGDCHDDDCPNSWEDEANA